MLLYTYLNVCQKVLTAKWQSPNVVNFVTYLGLGILILPLLPICHINISYQIVLNLLLMGLLGALGNYFIIKALSIGELSSLAPINSYKPVVALLAAIVYLKEIPSILSVLGIVLIICGSYFIFYNCSGIFDRKAVFYRVLALIFSATEAVFIKKIILLTDVTTAFVLWVLSGAIFSLLFLLKSGNKLKIVSWKYQFLLVLAVALMQYSTNYVFARVNVAYALALFQLSTLISVIYGVVLFHEKNLRRKLFASVLMVVGAVILILT